MRLTITRANSGLSLVAIQLASAARAPEVVASIGGSGMTPPPSAVKNPGGTGSGEGTGPAANAPTTVAAIKTLAKVRGDYGYFSLGKDYPPEAKQLGIEGDIKVRLVVGANGKVTAAVLLNRLGHGLDEIALTRAHQIEFEPARDTNDQPVSSVVVWTFHMTLPQ